MRPTILAATRTVALALACAAPAHADDAETQAQIRALVAEVQALRCRGRGTPCGAGAAAAPGTGCRVAGACPSGDMAAAPATVARETSPLTFTGYGEAIYTRPSERPGDAIADLTRVVLGGGYQFDDRTRLEFEAEWEHAVTSADDAGEAAIEQAYISREIGDSMQFQAGLFLIPMGIINERHEPPTFFGVFRPLTETAIIPTTWREGGLAMAGNTRQRIQLGPGRDHGIQPGELGPDQHRWPGIAARQHPPGAVVRRGRTISRYSAR